MPKALHDRLEREAREKGLTGARHDAYVYGTLRKVEKRAKKQARLLGKGKRLLGGE